MLTSAQHTTYLEMLDVAETETFPPRIAFIPAEALEGLPSDAFGNGELLLVGRKLEEDNDLVGCPCGNEHIYYSLVRADGTPTVSVISGTFGEQLDIPPDGQWDANREVKTAEWPDEVVGADDLSI